MSNNKVQITDISIKELSLENMPLIHKLRTEYFNTTPEVCIERARYYTDYFKNLRPEGEPMQISRAKAVNHYLSNRKPLFLNNNLLAGATTSKLIGTPTFPELIALLVWPELETISDRPANPIILSKEDADILNFEVYPYWMDRTVQEVTRKKFNNPLSLQLMEKIIFYINTKAGCISHCVPDYSRALNEGLEAIIHEAKEKEEHLKREPASEENSSKIDFYQSVQITLQGLINYAANLAKQAAKLAQSETNPTQKKLYEEMAQICTQVPAKPARTFKEAVNSLWLCQVGIHAENINMAISPGRIDQILYPFYKKDVKENGLTVEEAVEIGCCLFLKIADNTNLSPIAAERLYGGSGSTPAVTLGGVDQNGEDAVNDLTYIFLKVTELMRLRDPNMNARFHYEKNEKRYRQRVSEVIVSTKAIPAFHNDITDIQTLMKQGVSLEDARDYAIVGCVELASPGKDYSASGAIMFNLSSVMEMTLLNGKRFLTGDDQIGPQTGDPSTFTNFDQFWEAFQTQLKWLIAHAVDLNEKFGSVHQEMMQTPMLSSFFTGPMESGKDLIFGGARYNSSGASHVAYPDVVDSLNAIESAVFINKKYSMNEVIEAIKDNFQSDKNRQIQAYLKNKTPKFGEEHAIALKNSQNLVELLFNIYQGYTNYRGGLYRPAFWTMTTHAGQGKLAGALPSGRAGGEIFSSGITPASQAAKNLNEAYNSVAHLSADMIPGGEAFNIKYTPNTGNLSHEEYLGSFGDSVEGYFRNGGLQVQYNVHTYETLIDAKKNPEKYPELLVRVSGYSAYYKDLSEAMKDELITRTQYDLNSGEAVALPDNWRSDQ